MTILDKPVDWSKRVGDNFQWTFDEEIIPTIKRLAGNIPALGAGKNIDPDANAGNIEFEDRIVDFGVFNENDITFAKSTDEQQWFDIEQVVPEIRHEYKAGDITKDFRDRLIQNWFGVWKTINAMGPADFQHWVNANLDSPDVIRSRITSDGGTGIFDRLKNLPRILILGLVAVIAYILYKNV